MDLMLRIEFHWIGFREKIYRKPWFFLIKKKGWPCKFSRKSNDDFKDLMVSIW
jgi:hypothetical protein